MKHLKRYKIFEATYYSDDLNVNLTSTISDIFEDLTDDSDFDLNCFTIGYQTLKDAGATHTDNDIHFSLLREYYEHERDTLMSKYKTFTLNQVMPYLKRSIEYMESEGRFTKDIHYQYRVHSRVKQDDIKVDDLLLGDEFQIESLSITFTPTTDP